MKEESGRLGAKAYVTVLSTDNYLEGVLVLNESLRLCKSKYGLYVVMGSKVRKSVRDTLAKAGVRMINSQPLNIPEQIRLANLSSDHHRHWAGVFEKLIVFSLCQFRKIVYLDSDLLVIKNIDELFDKPHMSAVIADIYPGNHKCVYLNAGLMVIEPESDLTDRLIELLPNAFESEKQWRTAAGRPVSIGVQSVINMFWSEWISRNALHLDHKYNVMADQVDYYRRELDCKWRGPDGIHVLHFIGEVKPWMRTGTDFLRSAGGLVLDRRIGELAALMAYKAVLRSAQLRIRYVHQREHRGLNVFEI
ncbi:MAG TPA: glycosyltransferase [bacterium]|nr:glycosyltransferase [bacterium]